MEKYIIPLLTGGLDEETSQDVIPDTNLIVAENLRYGNGVVYGAFGGTMFDNPSEDPYTTDEIIRMVTGPDGVVWGIFMESVDDQHHTYAEIGGSGVVNGAGAEGYIYETVMYNNILYATCARDGDGYITAFDGTSTSGYYTPDIGGVSNHPVIDAAMYKGRCYYLLSDKRRLIASEPRTPHLFEDPLVEPIYSIGDDTSDCVGIIVYQDILYVFKEDSIYAVEGSLPRSIRKIETGGIGCGHKDTMQVTSKGIVFYRAGNLYLFNGSITKLTSGIDDLALTTHNYEGIPKVCSWVVDNVYFLSSVDNGIVSWLESYPTRSANDICLSIDLNGGMGGGFPITMLPQYGFVSVATPSETLAYYAYARTSVHGVLQHRDEGGVIYIRQGGLAGDTESRGEGGTIYSKPSLKEDNIIKNMFMQSTPVIQKLQTKWFSFGNRGNDKDIRTIYIYTEMGFNGASLRLITEINGVERDYTYDLDEYDGDDVLSPLDDDVTKYRLDLPAGIYADRASIEITSKGNRSRFAIQRIEIDYMSLRPM